VALRSGWSRVPLRFTRSPSPVPTRTFLSFLKRKPPSEVPASAPPPPVLAQDDLFHPLSHSPFPALVEKADRIKAISFCPTSYDRHGERVRPEFDCPDCGWPTHASEQRWQEGRAEHVEYCGRLREVNEDEHDIRSGRPMKEFDNMPGESGSVGRH
jgi:splicing suppressor protein 51